MSVTEYDFNTIYQLWEGLWNSFANITKFMNTDITPYVEDFLNTFFGNFDITIDIPFEWSLTQIFGGTTLLALLGLAMVAFAFRLAKDIINPFN